MAFVVRDESGAITSWFACAQPDLGELEELPDDASEVVAFLAATSDASLDAVISSENYLSRFTSDETTAIHTYALTSPPSADSLFVFNSLMLTAAAGTVDLRNATVVAGHARLVSLGLLTTDRSTAILTP